MIKADDGDGHIDEATNGGDCNSGTNNANTN
jgi:hypothetical protein